MAAPISLHASVTVTKEQVSCDLSGEAVILNLSSGEYFGLNAVAARIWELLQEGRTVLEVRDRLMQEYPDVESERCTKDLLTILADFVDADLVQVGI